MNNILLLISTILLLQSFQSCEKPYSTLELKKHFSTEQIVELDEITKFFKNQICKSDFETCFKQTNHDSLEANGFGIWIKIDFDEQKKIYKRISESTFNEIWMFCESTFYPSKTETKSLCAVATGKYQKYLTDLGKTNSRIAKYAKKIENSGDFSSLDFQYQEILNNKSSFDLKDPNIKLILAIHYLSMNDRAVRNAHLIKRPEPKFE